MRFRGVLEVEKFENVAAWATTNIFDGPRMLANWPYMFAGNVKLVTEAQEKAGLLKNQQGVAGL